MLKYLIVYIILIMIYLKKTIKFNFFNFFLNVFNIKIKVHGKENLKNYNDFKFIIMSNHVNGTDYPIIVHTINYYTNGYKKIYTIVKDDILGSNGDVNNIYNIFGIFKDTLYDKFNFIPYTRGDKNSGEITKNKMLDALYNNNNVLVFPEGECTKSGIPVDFKPGSFKLCSENNIWILPISLKYNQEIGVDRHEKVDINKWFNVSVNVYIHEPIFHTEWEKLKNDVLTIIKNPLT
jgi:1-acyl-sn-glycerol-3-phosphate acyltransferase